MQAANLLAEAFTIASLRGSLFTAEARAHIPPCIVSLRSVPKQYSTARKRYIQLRAGHHQADTGYPWHLAQMHDWLKQRPRSHSELGGIHCPADSKSIEGSETTEDRARWQHLHECMTR